MDWESIFRDIGEWKSVILIAIIIVFVIIITICCNFYCRHNTYTSQNNYSSEITRIERRRPRTLSIESTGSEPMNIELIHPSIRTKSRSNIHNV